MQTETMKRHEMLGSDQDDYNAVTLDHNLHPRKLRVDEGGHSHPP